MIRYNLHCGNGHAFDAWFGSAEAFDRASEVGANTCPVCGSHEIEKSLMAPSVSAKTRTAKSALDPERKQMVLANNDPRRKAMREAVKELRRKVEDSADYVGDKFPEEARKIHYEEVEPRGIYGEATGEEAKSLLDEGIDVLPLPNVPDDSN